MRISAKTDALFSVQSRSGKEAAEGAAVIGNKSILFELTIEVENKRDEPRVYATGIAMICFFKLSRRYKNLI